MRVERVNLRQSQSHAIGAAIEPIEQRLLFALTASTHHARPNLDMYSANPTENVQPHNSSVPANGARTPAQVRKSYGADNVKFGSVTGDGTGQTIALIEAFDDVSFVSDTSANFSISDLARFDAQFGLANPPSFKKFDQTGGTNYPTASPPAIWMTEIAMDVEWAHAMAPKANIWLVEANSDSDDDLNAAIDWARAQPAVSVINMSFGDDDYAGESADDAHFVAPAGHAGITFVSSSGDVGGTVQYPASSPNVVGVGGTGLFQGDSTGTWSSETAWSNSGGGISANEAKPIYQNLVNTTSAAQRTSPDVAADANPSTGVAVLNSAAGGIGSSNPWMSTAVGGTSLSAPLWAGFIAIVNQGRSLLSTPLPALNGSSETLPRLYTLASTDFHDITSGAAGSNNATAGYDLATGRGTPKLNLLAPDLAGGAKINGTVYQDNNGDDNLENSEAGLSGVAVYLDLNGNASFDAGIDPTTTTNASGAYSFSDLVGGKAFSVREIVPANFISTATGPVTGTTTYNGTTNVNLGNFPTVLNGSGGNDAFTVSLDDTATLFLISDGVNSFAIGKNQLNALTINGNAGDDSLTIDCTLGSAVPTGGITFDGGANATSAGDSIALIGSINAEVATFNPGVITFGSAINVPAVERFSFNGAGGKDTLTVNSGGVAIPASQTLQALTVAAGASVTMSAGGAKLLKTASLSLAGTIDLTDNALVLDYTGATQLPAILAQINSARAPVAGIATWTGVGITSSSAAANPRQFAVAALENSSLGANAYDTFFSQPVDVTAILVRCTAIGDANLDGQSNTLDFTRLASNFNKTGQTWGGGDFNFDGRVNALDFSALATSFGATLTAPAALPVGSLFGDKKVRADGMIELLG